MNRAADCGMVFLIGTAVGAVGAFLFLMVVLQFVRL